MGKAALIADVTEYFTSLHIPAPSFNARLTAGGPLSIDGLIRAAPRRKRRPRHRRLTSPSPGMGR